MSLKIQHSRSMQLIAGVTALALLAGGVKLLRGFNPQPDPPGVWGMMGVTPSDTIRMNVVNMQFGGGLPPDPCTVAMRFLDVTGRILDQKTFIILPTQAASFDYTPVGTTAFRTEVHPVLAIAANQLAGCSAVGSVEIFNTLSGETTVFAHPIFISLPSPATGQPNALATESR